jgi:hypothetical protein
MPARIRPASVVATLAGVVLIVLAAPRFVAGALTAPFDETVRALGGGDAVPDQALQLALGSRQRATSLTSDGRFFAEAAALRFAAYQRDPVAERLDLAIDAHRAAVERAPSQPFVWTRLATAVLSRDGYVPEVGAALRMSLLTGRFEPRLVLPRLELALPLWKRLPQDVRDGLAGQIVLAMKWDPERLAEAVRQSHRLAEARAALAAHPELRTRFNLLYQRRL